MNVTIPKVNDGTTKINDAIPRVSSVTIKKNISSRDLAMALSK